MDLGGPVFLLPPPRIPDGVVVQDAEIVNRFPHDAGAFTQGLLWCDGRLFESTGQRGHSELREVRLEDGAVLRRVAFPDTAWGEGIADWGGDIVGMTLESRVALRWSRDDFTPRASQAYDAKAWGLARAGNELVASDGTATLRFLDGDTLAQTRALRVLERGRPLGLLNDLAWMQGTLIANVFMTDTLARIDPRTGEAFARVDLSDIAAQSGRRDRRDVLNGIAFDADGERLFVTGKHWPRLFEIRLPPRPAGL